MLCIGADVEYHTKPHRQCGTVVPQSVVSYAARHRNVVVVSGRNNSSGAGERLEDTARRGWKDGSADSGEVFIAGHNDLLICCCTSRSRHRGF